MPDVCMGSWTNARWGRFFVRKRRRERGVREEKLQARGERVAIVVPPRSGEVLVLWAARASSWCRPLVCSCSGC